MSIIKLTIRTAPEHWFCVRPCFEQTTSVLNLSIVPLRKWHGQQCVCVCVCVVWFQVYSNWQMNLRSILEKLGLEKRNWNPGDSLDLPPPKAGMINLRTENATEGWCSLIWEPPGGLPGAQRLGLVGTPPTRDAHFLLSLAPAPCPQDSWSSVSSPLPWETGLAKLYNHCLHHFCFLPNVQKFY